MSITMAAVCRAGRSRRGSRWTPVPVAGTIPTICKAIRKTTIATTRRGTAKVLPPAPNTPSTTKSNSCSNNDSRATSLVWPFARYLIPERRSSDMSSAWHCDLRAPRTLTRGRASICRTVILTHPADGPPPTPFRSPPFLRRDRGSWNECAIAPRTCPADSLAVPLPGGPRHPRVGHCRWATRTICCLPALIPKRTTRVCEH
mmetsp:Transcript_46274/g.97237  ORF Transcript_46274/g.97237 Transcript_46274/m.97237 type:complete len:202 (+) Transcript_46274:1128-1733(+)